MVAPWVLMKVKILLLHPGLLGMVEKMPVENCISSDFFNGVRRLGSAATDMSHVGLGITKGYWEYQIKQWDMAAKIGSILFRMPMLSRGHIAFRLQHSYMIGARFIMQLTS